MNSESAINTPCWYAIHTHPRQESRAANNLKAWNVETFYPQTLRCNFNDFTGKPSYVTKPLFPGYLFARFALESLFRKVRYTRGVHSIVCVGDTPAEVDDRVIEIIAAQVDEAGYVNLGKELEPGSKVLIQAGPFRGLTGIFERETSDTGRIKILLDTVYYQARLEVDKRLVKAVDP
ncbi:MAG: hypothetical protein J2P21_00055 [Chloracidobacterium sp.]|nr:hypothetical protein [Chloracidobacterium sp.]